MVYVKMYSYMKVYILYKVNKIIFYYVYIYVYVFDLFCVGCKFVLDWVLEILLLCLLW